MQRKSGVRDLVENISHSQSRMADGNLNSVSTPPAASDGACGPFVTKWWRLVAETAAIFLCYFAFALMDNINSSTALDIKIVTGSSTADVNYAMVAKAAGYCVGAVALGSLMDFLQTERRRCLAFVLFVLASAASVLAVIFISSSWEYMLTQASLGVTQAGIETTAQPWIIELWLDRSPPVLQALHMAYAAGMSVMPLIASPFLSFNATQEAAVNGTNGDPGSHGGSQVGHAYIITAIMAIASAGVLLVTHFCLSSGYGRRRSSSLDGQCRSTGAVAAANESDERKPIVAPSKSVLYVASVVVIGSLFSAAKIGMSVLINTMLPQFLVFSGLSDSSKAAAPMLSVQSMATIASTLIAILILLFISPDALYYNDLMLFGAGQLCLLFSSSSSMATVWAGVVLSGLGNGNSFSALYSMLQRRIHISHTVSGLFMFSGRASVIIVLTVLAPLMEPTPVLFLYVNLGLTVSCFVLCFILCAVDRWL